MAASDQEQPTSGASTSFRWTYGGKEGREVFSLETTIAGPTDAEIENHLPARSRPWPPSSTTGRGDSIIFRFQNNPCLHNDCSEEQRTTLH
jgi:hypothetical protein